MTYHDLNREDNKPKVVINTLQVKRAGSEMQGLGQADVQSSQGEAEQDLQAAGSAWLTQSGISV